MLLIVNSSKRSEGTPTNFTVNLSPPITFHIITLLYATISNPINNTQPYFMISISDVTPNVRAIPQLLPQSDITGTFIMPVISAGGTRNMYAERGLFTQTVNCNNLTLSQLKIRIHHPHGIVATTDESIILILQLDP
jgi:hypothetical protein